ncbi:MAG TPA: MOSC domain-containing protein [Candidatus Saccharimonadia bacterium]|jgi:uncharacterized protein YcbX
MVGPKVEMLEIGRSVKGDHAIAVINEAGEVLTAKQSAGVPLLTVGAWAYPSRGEELYWVSVPETEGYYEGPHDDPGVRAALSALLGFPAKIVKISDEPSPQRRIDGQPVRPDTFADEVDIHIVTSASVQAAEELTRTRGMVRRTRPQVVIQTLDDILPWAEVGWVGQRMRIGNNLVVKLDNRTRRCALPGRPQFQLEAAPNLLRWLKTHQDNRFGLSASIVEPGTIRYGDVIALV